MSNSKIVKLLESVKKGDSGVGDAVDYFSRYIEDCENPDTIPKYHSELLEKIISNQKIIMNIIDDILEVLDTKE